MADDIQGVTIDSTYSSPKIAYRIGYKATRENNSEAKFDFTVEGLLKGSSSTAFGTGYSLKITITAGGRSCTAVIKEKTAIWSGGSAAGTVKATARLKLTCPSAKGNEELKISFKAERPDASGNSGRVNNDSYVIVTPPLIVTPCTAPSEFTAEPEEFEDEVELYWSGAMAGQANGISGYGIHYAAGEGFEEYRLLTTVSGSSAVIKASDFCEPGQRIKFAIQTLGEAGERYNSAYKYSAAIRRRAYTPCKAPSEFTAEPEEFEEEVTLRWRADDLGENVRGFGIYARYGDAEELTEIGEVDLGQEYLRIRPEGGADRLIFAIRTLPVEGGEEYASPIIYSNEVRRVESRVHILSSRCWRRGELAICLGGKHYRGEIKNQRRR